MVRHTPDEGLWDFLDDHLVACLGWGLAARKVASRDQLICWNREIQETNLYKVVNNVRFLVLPWVNIQNLASKVLAFNIRILQDDWQTFYNQPINLMETFVDTTRFKGTCYKAANWHYAGKQKALANTPPAGLKLLFGLIEEVDKLNKRVEELEAKLGENSSNSNKHSSTDSLHKEKTPKDKKRNNHSTKAARITGKSL